MTAADVGRRMGGGSMDGFRCEKCQNLWFSNATHPEGTYFWITRYCPNCLPTMSNTQEVGNLDTRRQPGIIMRTPLVKIPYVPEGE